MAPLTTGIKTRELLAVIPTIHVNNTDGSTIAASWEGGAKFKVLGGTLVTASDTDSIKQDGFEGLAVFDSRNGKVTVTEILF